MLLKTRRCEPEPLIMAGMFCLAVGLVSHRYIHPPGEIWQGLADGIFGLLIGMSMALNLCGLARRRKQRDDGGR